MKGQKHKKVSSSNNYKTISNTSWNKQSQKEDRRLVKVHPATKKQHSNNNVSLFY